MAAVRVRVAYLAEAPAAGRDTAAFRPARTRAHRMVRGLGIRPYQGPDLAPDLPGDGCWAVAVFRG